MVTYSHKKLLMQIYKKPICQRHDNLICIGRVTLVDKYMSRCFFENLCIGSFNGYMVVYIKQHSELRFNRKLKKNKKNKKQPTEKRFFVNVLEFCLY